MMVSADLVLSEGHEGRIGSRTLPGLPMATSSLSALRLPSVHVYVSKPPLLARMLDILDQGYPQDLLLLT